MAVHPVDGWVGSDAWGIDAVTDDGRGTAFGGEGGPDDNASRYVYDLEDIESPSEGVVLAVSAVVGRPPDELDPLYDAVDPDALDALCSRRQNGSLRTRVTFRFEECTVPVDGTDRVEVER